jgi:hypothetical protein
MPLYWTIDSRQRLFTVRAEGPVTAGDVMGFLQAVSGAGALAYSKLFDGRAGTWLLNDQDVLSVCAEARSYHQRGRMGALALVLTPEQTLQLARLLGVLAAADRPMKVFQNPRRARRWIDSMSRPTPDIRSREALPPTERPIPEVLKLRSRDPEAV